MADAATAESAKAEVLRKVCQIVAQAPSDLLSLSFDLLKRAAKAAALTLPEEGVLEMWLTREKQAKLLQCVGKQGN